MKLTTWNCARGFLGKKEHIFSHAPDIAVIQECSKKSTELLSLNGYAGEWVGTNQNIGMGVFYKKDVWCVKKLASPPDDIEWVAPFEVTGPENFTLIAIWACQVRRNKRLSYVGQINRALEHSPKWFEDGPVVVAGDFNSNARWDKERPNWNHSTMVAGLRSHGLASVYQTLKDEEHGQETIPTFHLHRNRGRPYHIDYIFASHAWLPRLHLSVGDCFEWLSYSDHCPLTVSLSTQ